MRQAMIFGAKSEAEERIMTYFIFAEYWGWTPKQVDELDVDVLYKLRFLLAESVKERAKPKRNEAKMLKGVGFNV